MTGCIIMCRALLPPPPLQTCSGHSLACLCVYDREPFSACMITSVFMSKSACFCVCACIHRWLMHLSFPCTGCMLKHTWQICLCYVWVAHAHRENHLLHTDWLLPLSLCLSIDPYHLVRPTSVVRSPISSPPVHLWRCYFTQGFLAYVSDSFSHASLSLYYYGLMRFCYTLITLFNQYPLTSTFKKCIYVAFD